MSCGRWWRGQEEAAKQRGLRPLVGNWQGEASSVVGSLELGIPVPQDPVWDLSPSCRLQSPEITGASCGLSGAKPRGL